MKKKYEVFISSTYADLQEERKYVMEALLECDCFPAGMEMFPALDMKQFEYIKTLIDKSDYYILIIAGRYGSISSNGLSFTEMEYNYAVEQGIPILAFLKEDIESIPPNKTDQSKNLKKRLNAFRDRVCRDRLCKFWNDPLKLKADIITSLHSAFKKLPREGWVRPSEYLAKMGKQPESNKINSEAASKMRQYRNQLIIEAYKGDDQIYQSDRIAGIQDPLGVDDFRGLFNASFIGVVKAYSRMDEFANLVYHLTSEELGQDIDKVIATFIEKGTDIMQFSVEIIWDGDTLSCGILDWKSTDNVFIFGDDFMK